MKTNMICGRIKKETEKAYLIDGTWVPKSIVVEKLRVVGEVYQGEVEMYKDKPGREEYLIIPKFPVEVSGGSSAVYTVVTEDGRWFTKTGFSGWTEVTK